MTPDPEHHRLPPGILAGLLREQLETYAVLADRISLAGQAAAGRGGVDEVKEAEDTVRWLQRFTRTVLGGPEDGGDQEPSRTDVSAAARRTVRRWARTMPDLDVSVDVDRGTWVAVPPTVLERILQGLLTFAARRARRRVRLVVSRTGDEVVLRSEGDAPTGPDSDGGGRSTTSDPEVEVLCWLVERSGGSLAADAGRGGVGGGMGVRLPVGATRGGTDRRHAG